MWRFGAILFTIGTTLAASMAGAVELNVINVGGNSATINPGETVGIEITITNSSGTSLVGLGVSLWDYDESVVDFVSGEAVTSFFNSSCVGPGLCLGGIEQVSNAFFDPSSLAESEIGTNGNRVQLFLAAVLVPVSNTGIGVDQGLDLNVGTAQSLITFRAVGLGSTTLRIDTGYQGDAVVLPGGLIEEAVGTPFTINVVPEPTMALLLGMGLAALAGSRRWDETGGQNPGMC